MSHELRTPFRYVYQTTTPVAFQTDYKSSSFYGLLDLLSGTELNQGQSEIGSVALFQ